MKDYATKLAIIFSRAMCNELGDDLYTVIQRNNDYIQEGIDCDAAHDYTDANETMMTAFRSLFNRDPRVENQDDLDIINAAWRLAREQEYYYTK